MNAAVALLVFLTLQRLIELTISARNTRALFARGAYEVGADHYPYMIALHASWLITLWFLGFRHPIVPGFVAFFVILQCARLWTLRTLGSRWTTRIIILPNASRVTSGPYHFLAHPNYLVVALELPCVSLALGLPWHALAFGLLNLAMLRVRIRAEDAAWDERPEARGVRGKEEKSILVAGRGQAH
jgi:methyltransferase